MTYFAASTDDAETNKKFAESLEATFPILADPGKEAAKAYGVLTAVGFAARRTFYIGKDGKILFVDTDVKTKTAGADIVERLGKLGLPKK